MKDYYKILEVNENSSEDEIKKSYRNLSKKYHPDLNPDGAEKFKEIAEAYEVLSDSNKRQVYDNQKNNPGGFHNMGDIFSHMFGDSPIFGQNRPRKSPDKIVKIQLTPIDSYLGVDKTIQYMKDIHCDVCNGSGGDKQACGTCKGQGFQIRTFGTGFMIQQVRTQCGSCGGRGYTLVRRCGSCDGKGKKPSVSTINIKIPHAIDEGQFMRLGGLGDFHDGNYGDLIIQVQMSPKDGFEKMNNDLIYNLFLNIQELTQDKYKVPHPEGDLFVNAPKVFDTSKPLRIKNRGYNGGDMYIKLNVKFDRDLQ